MTLTEWLRDPNPASRLQSRMAQSYLNWLRFRRNRLAMLGLFNVIGSLGIGWAVGRWRMKSLLSLVYAVRALAVLAFLLAPKTGVAMLLFAAGGLIGVFIAGRNVRIPAHYHGCIVGVTLALMGLVYLLLPQLGYGTPQGRLAVAQPYLYGAGQLLHIVGLVWSGGYGVQRKVAGAEQVLRSTAEIAGMGLMGLGGLIAIIGGLLFVVVVISAMRPRAPVGAR